MTDKDQVRPLAPAAERSTSDDEETAVVGIGHRRKKCLKCCGCVTALLVVEAVVAVVLIFTVFKVKDPVIKMNGVSVDRLDLINGTTPRPGSNISITADVSVKNPNFASFRYSNTTSSLYYHGTVVGEARGPPGQAKARRTMRMNITVDIITDRLISNPSLTRDLESELIMLTSFTRVGGRVKILNLIRKHVVVKMNCSMSVNVTSQAIIDQKCKRKVKL